MRFVIGILLLSTACFGKDDNANSNPVQIGAFAVNNPNGVSVIFDDMGASGFNFYITNVESLEGLISSAFGDFTMNQNGVNETYRDDLTILVATADLSYIHLQIGGWTSAGATHDFSRCWPEGGVESAGPAGGSVDFGYDINVHGYYIFIGNGYSGGGLNSWSGSINLVGSVVDNDHTSFGAVKALFN